MGEGPSGEVSASADRMPAERETRAWAPLSPLIDSVARQLRRRHHIHHPCRRMGFPPAGWRSSADNDATVRQPEQPRDHYVALPIFCGGCPASPEFKVLVACGVMVRLGVGRGRFCHGPLGWRSDSRDQASNEFAGVVDQVGEGVGGEPGRLQRAAVAAVAEGDTVVIHD